MVKMKSIGVALGALLVTAFAGYGSGCSSTSTTTVQNDGGQSEGGGGNDSDAGPSCTDRSPDPAPFRPPLSNSGLCSEAQITGFVAACSATADPAACSAFSKDAANAGCVNGCILLDPQGGDAPSYGALIGTMYNAAGYMLLNGASRTCAEALHNSSLCLYIACYDCADSDLNACGEAALSPGGVCEAYGKTEVENCGGAADDAAFKKFQDVRDNDPAAFFRTFCGGASDASTDG